MPNDKDSSAKIFAPNWKILQSNVGKGKKNDCSNNVLWLINQ